MTATKTSKTRKDAEGADFSAAVLDESGNGAGPFYDLQASVDRSGAVVNPATEDTLASVNARLAGGVTTAPVVGAFVDRSGTIVAAAASQIVASAKADRRRLLVQNPGTPAGQGIASVESLFVNFMTAAAVDAGTSLEIYPGGSFDTAAGPVTGDAITVAAATIGHRFIVKEM